MPNNLSNLKSTVDKLHIGRLETAAVDFNQLSESENLWNVKKNIMN